MKFFIVISLTLLTIQAISCRSKKSTESQGSLEKEVVNDSIKSITIDTTIKEITQIAPPPVIPWEVTRSRIIKLLGLSDISNNENQAEIRIWVGYASSDSVNLIVLKNNKKEWQSAAYYTEVFYDKDRDVSSVQKRVEKNNPVSGWKKVSSDLNNLGMYKLKNYNDIPHYSTCNDGGYMWIEVWRNGVYNQYEYPCLEAHLDKNDAKRVQEICLLIEKEFGYRVFDPLR